MMNGGCEHLVPKRENGKYVYICKETLGTLSYRCALCPPMFHQQNTGVCCNLVKGGRCHCFSDRNLFVKASSRQHTQHTPCYYWVVAVRLYTPDLFLFFFSFLFKNLNWQNWRQLCSLNTSIGPISRSYKMLKQKSAKHINNCLYQL